MCTICNGATHEEVLAEHHDRIQRQGFSIVGVGPPRGAGTGNWAYTIGLAARGHPELVLANAKREATNDMLTQIAGWVCDGDWFAPDDTVPIVGSGDELRLARVHPHQLRGNLMAFWHLYHHWLGVDPPALEALQVVLPPTFFCSHHRRSQPRLDLPGDYAARCAAARRQPRRRKKKRRRH